MKNWEYSTTQIAETSTLTAFDVLNVHFFQNSKRLLAGVRKFAVSGWKKSQKDYLVQKVPKGQASSKHMLEGRLWEQLILG